ncbi:CidA/LrgA family protein [Paludibacterium yongneupense]|uniref:CidA/LrgA family protein n=1 Tax=Paludibacterium yongneupense TaxID=400061 RepID=UPI0004080527|nr:CidA/LrgA family protein [Paludibacterium yongneupense]
MKFINLLYTVAQVALISALLWICNLVVAHLGLPVPGSVLGLGILALLLISGAIPEKWIAIGAAWLMADMLLFFIPPVVAVLKYRTLLAPCGLGLIAILIIGTATVMIGTAWVVDRVFVLEHRRYQEKENA